MQRFFFSHGAMKCTMRSSCCMHAGVFAQSSGAKRSPFPIIEFIAFVDGFTPSGFWKHTLDNVTHTSLSLSFSLLHKRQVTSTNTHGLSLPFSSHSIMHSNVGTHCENRLVLLNVTSKATLTSISGPASPLGSAPRRETSEVNVYKSEPSSAF